jgi:hypothetical protein
MLAAFQRRLSRKFKRTPVPVNVLEDGGIAQLRDRLEERDKHLARAYNRLLRHYFPKKTETPLVYFSAEYSGGRTQSLGSNVELVHLPGGHWGCITTHVDVLAGHLRVRLDKLSPAAT